MDLPSEVIGIADIEGQAAMLTLPVAPGRGNDMARLAVGKGIDQSGPGKTENGRRRADPQRHGPDRDEMKTGAFPKKPECIAAIFPEFSNK